MHFYTVLSKADKRFIDEAAEFPSNFQSRKKNCVRVENPDRRPKTAYSKRIWAGPRSGSDVGLDNSGRRDAVAPEKRERRRAKRPPFIRHSSRLRIAVSGQQRRQLAILAPSTAVAPRPSKKRLLLGAPERAVELSWEKIRVSPGRRLQKPPSAGAADKFSCHVSRWPSEQSGMWQKHARLVSFYELFVRRKATNHLHSIQYTKPITTRLRITRQAWSRD